MSEPKNLSKHALECLRLEADCMQLAGASPNPNVQSHFLRMARVWSGMATAGLSGNAGRRTAAGKA